MRVELDQLRSHDLLHILFKLKFRYVTMAHVNSTHSFGPHSTTPSHPFPLAYSLPQPTHFIVLKIFSHLRDFTCSLPSASLLLTQISTVLLQDLFLLSTNFQIIKKYISCTLCTKYHSLITISLS